MIKSLFSKLDYLLPPDLADQVDLSTLFRARFMVISSLIGFFAISFFFAGTVYLDLSLAIKLRSFIAMLIFSSLLLVFKTCRKNFEAFLDVGSALQVLLLLVLIYLDTFTAGGFGFVSLVWFIPVFLMSAFYFRPIVGAFYIIFNVIFVGILTYITEGSYFKSVLQIPNFEAAYLLTIAMALIFSAGLTFFIIQLNELLKEELSNQRSLLEESAKFQSLGQMASNLAHDINNPLFSIQGKLHQMRNLFSQDKLDMNKCDLIIEDVEATILKLSQIVKGITTFARQGTGDQMVSVNVDDLIQSMVLLLNDKIDQLNIQCTISVQPHTYLICYPSFISRVLINLLNNSFSALENVERKKIEIRAFENGEYIEIHVRDNGPGVDPGIEGNIFNSAHAKIATKKLGKGVGLGLSISAGLIKLHEGTLTYNREESMTNFVIKLPSYE